MRCLLLLLLIRHAQPELSCSGCADPIDTLSVWTDNSSIWRCEKMQRNFMDECRDVVEIYCRRKEYLGGSLYIMTFPQSPAIDGIKPDHVRKSNGSLTSISMTCNDGRWKISKRNRTQHYILCDQFITEDKRSDNLSSMVNGSSSTTSTMFTAGSENISTTKRISTMEISAISYVTTGSPLISEAGYDFIGLTYATVAKHRKRKAKAGNKIRPNRRLKPKGVLKGRRRRLQWKKLLRKQAVNMSSKKKAVKIA